MLVLKDQDRLKKIHRSCLITHKKIHGFIDVSNTIISIYVYLIGLISNIIVPSEVYYSFDEFNFIYECLRSLDKIEKNVTIRNCIIHNIDLELQKIEKLIGRNRRH